MEGVGYQYEQQRNYEGCKGKIKIKGDQMVVELAVAACLPNIRSMRHNA